MTVEENYHHNHFHHYYNHLYTSILHPTPKNHLNTFTMASIEQTWSLAGKVAVVTGSGKLKHIQDHIYNTNYD